MARRPQKAVRAGSVARCFGRESAALDFTGALLARETFHALGFKRTALRDRAARGFQRAGLNAQEQLIAGLDGAGLAFRTRPMRIAARDRCDCAGCSIERAARASASHRALKTARLSRSIDRTAAAYLQDRSPPRFQDRACAVLRRPRCTSKRDALAPCRRVRALQPMDCGKFRRELQRVLRSICVCLLDLRIWLLICSSARAACSTFCASWSDQSPSLRARRRRLASSDKASCQAAHHERFDAFCMVPPPIPLPSHEIRLGPRPLAIRRARSAAPRPPRREAARFKPGAREAAPCPPRSRDPSSLCDLRGATRRRRRARRGRAPIRTAGSLRVTRDNSRASALRWRSARSGEH
jgi:hypothetical protein